MYIIEFIKTNWEFLAGFTTVVAGVAAFYANMLKIRESINKKYLSEDVKKKYNTELRTIIRSFGFGPATKVAGNEESIVSATTSRTSGYLILLLIAALVFMFAIYCVMVSSAEEITISRPEPGANVSQIEVVEGNSKVRSFSHYLVVVPMGTGDRYIVDGPLPVRPNGSFSGNARFGEYQLGVGERYCIFVLAVREHLREGLLNNISYGAKKSEIVEVFRAR